MKWPPKSKKKKKKKGKNRFLFYFILFFYIPRNHVEYLIRIIQELKNKLKKINNFKKKSIKTPMIINILN